MKWVVHFLPPLLMLLMLNESYVLPEDIFIPWNSSLAPGTMFIVNFNDVVRFTPCGITSNLIYTDSKEVFDQCTPQANISSDVIYNHIGDCANPTNQLIVVVKTGSVGVTFVSFEEGGVYYFLSDSMSDCENGLKVIIRLPGPTITTTNAGTGPTNDSPGTGPTNGIPGTGPTNGVNPTVAGNADENFLGPLSLTQFIIALCVTVAVIVIITITVLLVIGLSYVSMHKKKKCSKVLKSPTAPTKNSLQHGSQLSTLSNGNCENHQPTSAICPSDTRQLIASEDTDSHVQGHKPKHKEVAHLEPKSVQAGANSSRPVGREPPMEMKSFPARNSPAKPKHKELVHLEPKSLQARANFSRSGGREPPMEMTSIPARNSPAKPKRNQVDALSDMHSRPAKASATSVGQSLPPISVAQVRPASNVVRSVTSTSNHYPANPRAVQATKSPTRPAPKPPTKQSDNPVTNRRAPGPLPHIK